MSGFDVALSEAEICDVIFQHPILIKQYWVLTCKIPCQADMQICNVYLGPYSRSTSAVRRAEYAQVGQQGPAATVPHIALQRYLPGKLSGLGVLPSRHHPRSATREESARSTIA